MLQGKDLLESKLTAANILLRVSDEQIFSKYISKVEGSICSPFRTDKKASCGFYRNSSGRLVLHDFAQDMSWNCFEAIMEKYKLNFGQVLKLINDDLNLKLGTTNPSPVNKELEIKIIETTKTDIEITYSIKPYEKNEIEYWAHYGVSSDTLLKYGVYCVKAVKFGDNGWRSTKGNPIFVYTTNDSTKFKLYRPLSSTFKWLAKTNKNVLWGLTQLPLQGKLLVITKSLKDVMVLHELGIPAICPNSESTNIPNTVIKELRKRFQYIVSFYDYDNAGIQAALKLDIPYMFLFKSKDISDYYKRYGKYSSYRMLKRILSKSYHRYEKFLFHAYSGKHGSGNPRNLKREDSLPF